MRLFSDKYRYYFRKIFVVSYPVMLGQAGHMMTSTADTIMVGRLGSLPLAAVAFASIMFMIPFAFAIGFSVGLTPLAGKAFGEKDDVRNSALLKHALLMNLGLGVLLSIVMFIMSRFMDHMGQEPAEIALARPFFNILNVSIIPLMIFMTLKQFTEGLGLTKPGMVVSIALNLLNVLLNWLLIYGKWGFPELGMHGAAWATFTARIGMALCMLGYVYYSPLRKYFSGLGEYVTNKALYGELFRTGVPIGLQFFLEVGAFIAGAIMVGWISHEALAAHQVAITMCALTYLMSSGLGTGATIIISNLMGKKEHTDVRIAGRASFIMVLMFMSCCAAIFLVFRHQLPWLFSDDHEVVTIAASLLIWGAFFQLSDGLQAVIIGALRGMADVNAPMVIAAISYWAITLPIAYVLAFTMGLGAPGVWIGYFTGLTIASVLLYLRFNNRVAKLVP